MAATRGRARAADHIRAGLPRITLAGTAAIPEDRHEEVILARPRRALPAATTGAAEITVAATPAGVAMAAETAAVPPVAIMAVADRMVAIPAGARTAETPAVAVVHTEEIPEATTITDFHPVSSLLTHRQEAPQGASCPPRETRRSG